MSEELDPLVLQKLAINQATTRTRWSNEQSLEGYARHGIQHVTLWRDKVSEIGVRKTKELLSRLGLKVSGLNRIGPVFDNDGRLDAKFIEDAKLGIEEAHDLDADNLMYFPGTSLPNYCDLGDARKQSVDILHQVYEVAKQANVKLVLEPLHPMIAGDRSCFNTMKQCNDICDLVGPELGVVVDVYHVWWDPELQSEISRAGSDRLMGFHINDWLVPTKDLLRDRGMIGDGVIELKKIRGWMENSGYRGPVEIEIFSDYWWDQDPDTVIQTAIERTLKLA